MPILTVRLTADEKRLLTKRSRDAGMKKAAFVKQLIREELVTGADVVKDAERRMGAARMGATAWAMRGCASRGCVLRVRTLANEELSARSSFIPAGRTLVR